MHLKFCGFLFWRVVGFWVVLFGFGVFICAFWCVLDSLFMFFVVMVYTEWIRRCEIC